MRLFTLLLLAVPLFGQTIPDGFTNTIVASLPAPTAIAFTPDGRMLVTTQGGALRVISPSGLVATPALTIPSASICTNSERGMLGVAVDPDFASNGFLYLYYTFRPPGTNCGSRALPMPFNRVSRFTMSGNGIDPASEKPLIENIPSWNGNHNAGDLHFGNDGYLYISTGDSGCDPYGSGCAGTNDAARDVHTLLGKILRIDRDGNIPPSNPYTGPGTQRCHLTNAPNGVRCQETYAWGLRNPFRIAFDRNDLTQNRFFILDVGQDAWEEVNLGAAAADYGWNLREGACLNGSRTNCPSPPATITDPVFSYPHDIPVPDTQSSRCNSIAGGAFVPSGIWPAEFNGSFLFADYVCGSIFRINQQPDRTWKVTDFIRGLGANSAVHLTFGPFNSTQALYYTTYAAGGQVRRIAYTAGRPNASPTAVISANPTSGPAPLLVNFSAQGSADPDAGDTLTYLWDFGDQTPATATTTPTAQHTYSRAGTYTATLRARDPQGALSQPVSIRIFAGNNAPVPTLLAPQSFSVGQTITLSATATDAEDGSLPASAFTWTVILHHDTHTHPFLGPLTGREISLVGPSPEDLAATGNSYLEVRLQARDSAGEVTVISRDLKPVLIDVRFESSPAGLVLRVNGFDFTTPRRVVSWAGYTLDFTIPDQDLNGSHYAFTSWSNNGSRSQRLDTPASPLTLSANFERIGESGNSTWINDASGLSGSLAPGSLATVERIGLATATFVADGTGWPQEALGLRISIEDSEGTSRDAALYVVAQDYATFEIPNDTKPGRMVLRARRGEEILATAYSTAEPAAPGIFTETGNGRGNARGFTEPAAAGSIVRLQATGIRNASTVRALLGGVNAEILSVAAQDFPGLDLIELRIPLALAGRGLVAAQISADGKAANLVNIPVR
jgi:uncharacterized protein (TIGR03437 family)